MSALSSLEDVSVHPTPDYYTFFLHTFPQAERAFLSFRLQNMAKYDIFFAEDALINKHAFGEIKLNEKRTPYDDSTPTKTSTNYR